MSWISDKTRSPRNCAANSALEPPGMRSTARRERRCAGGSSPRRWTVDIPERMCQGARFVAVALISLALSGAQANSQGIPDVMPAVVFLQGQGVRKMQVDEKEVEVWIKEPDWKTPRRLKVNSTGTGVIVRHENRLFLATAQHVAIAVRFNTTATLRGPNDKPLLFPLSELMGDLVTTWVSHDEADVAVLPLDPPNTFTGAIKALTLDQFATDEVSPDFELFLTTVGFPLQLGVQDKFSPIVTVSHPASGFFRYPRFDNEIEATFFILDDPSVAGFSGAPVFRLPRVRMGGLSSGQGAFECVGLVHGTFNDKTGGKFAAVVPAKFVAETVSRAAAQEQPGPNPVEGHR